MKIFSNCFFTRWIRLESDTPHCIVVQRTSASSQDPNHFDLFRVHSLNACVDCAHRSTCRPSPWSQIAFACIRRARISHWAHMPSRHTLCIAVLRARRLAFSPKNRVKVDSKPPNTTDSFQSKKNQFSFSWWISWDHPSIKDFLKKIKSVH